MGALPPPSRERLSTPLATAFGHTFMLALALTALIVVPMVLMRSGRAAASQGEIAEPVLP
jgi:hypothetical protein